MHLLGVYEMISYAQVRMGARVSNEEILGFAKLFNDELTLDNISRFSSFHFFDFTLTVCVAIFLLTFLSRFCFCYHADLD